MTTLDHIRSHHGLRARLADLIDAMRDGWQGYQLYHATLRELGALNDRELADLGLHRSMIRQTAQEAVRKHFSA